MSGAFPLTILTVSVFETLIWQVNGLTINFIAVVYSRRIDVYMHTKQQQNCELHFTVYTNKQYRYTKRLLVLLKYLFVIQQCVTLCT